MIARLARSNRRASSWTRCSVSSGRCGPLVICTNWYSISSPAYRLAIRV
jgi:hypothetical protein